MRHTLVMMLVSAAVTFSFVSPAYVQSNGSEVPPQAVSPETPKEKAKEERFVPTFIETEFLVKSERFVTGELVVVEGVVAFDQIFSVHWDELTPERLRLGPFKVVKVTVGPQRPSWKSKDFFADERSVRIVLVLEDKTKRGKMTIPAFSLGYSWQEGEKISAKQMEIGPWEVERVPIKLSVSLTPSVLHLGEKAELVVRVVRDKNVKVLNQFLGVLKDDKAPEAAKAEVRRWLKSLEVRKESAFNIDSPDIKPFTVLERAVREVERNGSKISIYTYKIAYYQEARKEVRLPDVKIWYMLEGRESSESGYKDPQSIGVSGLGLSIASRLAGKDRRLDGPAFPPQVGYGLAVKYFFDYGLFVSGVLALVAGSTMLFRRKGRKGRNVAKHEKPIQFRKASHEILFFLSRSSNIYPVRDGWVLSNRAVTMLRERLFALIGAVLAMSHEEAQAKTADEMVELLLKRFNRAYIEPVTELLFWCDQALSLSEVPTTEGVQLSGVMLKRTRPFFNSESYWDSLAQI